MKDSQLQETSQEKIITSLLNIPGAKTGLLNCTIDTVTEC